VKWLKILAAVVLLAAVTAWVAWRLFPVQILVLVYRLGNPVAATRAVHWAQGPAKPPAGDRPPNIVLIVADDLGINDITLEGRGSGVAGGLVPTPNIDPIARPFSKRNTKRPKMRPQIRRRLRRRSCGARNNTNDQEDCGR